MTEKKELSTPANRPGVYRRSFRLPPELLNRELEFFCPGFEASDELWLNGRKIGEHEFRKATLDLKAMTYIPHGKDHATSDLDPDTEYGFFSDPITLPKLEPRFYDLPAALLKTDADNELVLVLKTDSQKACPHSMEIRPRTPNRAALGNYLKTGRFFAALRQMPKAEISTVLTKDGLKVSNPSAQIALMVIVEFIPAATGVAVPLNDNAFHLLPGEEKILTPLVGNEQLAQPAQIRTYGWNI
jgi:hypothetical protein